MYVIMVALSQNYMLQDHLTAECQVTQSQMSLYYTTASTLARPTHVSIDRELWPKQNSLDMQYAH